MDASRGHLIQLKWIWLEIRYNDATSDSATGICQKIMKFATLDNPSVVRICDKLGFHKVVVLR